MYKDLLSKKVQEVSVAVKAEPLAQRTCPKCKAQTSNEVLKRTLSVCPECGSYLRLHVKRRISLVADIRSFKEWDSDFLIANPLEFEGYEEKIMNLNATCNLKEAVITGECRIDGVRTAICVMDSRFMMASMGHVVGEKITRAVERATDMKLPIVIFCCSGGARMQEGIISLMQMAKTSAAIKKHSEAGLLYISVLTEPTTGGVTASFAMLGDVILAEPGALIGFAGPRVIEQTIGQKLPEGFQRAEFQVEHGFVDAIVKREELKTTLASILKMHQPAKTNALMKNMKSMLKSSAADYSAVDTGLTAAERVKIARMKERPTGLDYINKLFTDFIEFHGDRYFKDDAAIVGGIAYFHGQPVTVICQQKGKISLEENMKRNFGMPSPDGYRKALRLMKQAEKFNRPIICLIDTSGAYPGKEAEERGQGEAIARNLFEMSALKTPVLSVVIGEGGSGGALAIGVADEVWMLENSIYSILSPEGFASILWKDGSRADEAANVMKITAKDLYDLNVIERIIRETKPVTSGDMDEVCAQLDEGFSYFIEKYQGVNKKKLVEERYKRYRKF